jgi:hypothetical protein
MPNYPKIAEAYPKPKRESEGKKHKVNVLKDTPSGIQMRLKITSQSEGFKVKVLIDTGASTSNYLSHRFLSQLKAESATLLPCSDTVQSGLAAGGCHTVLGKSTGLLLDGKDDFLEPFSIGLDVLITELEDYDLIVGMRTIIEHSLLFRMPYQIESSVGSSDLLFTIRGRQGPAVLGEFQDDDEYEAEEITAIDLRDQDRAPTTDELLGMVNFPNDGLSLVQRQRLQTLLAEFKDIFSVTVRSEPANVTPMTLHVDRAQWEAPRNQLPPRVQGTVRLTELRRQVQLLRSLGVIRPSRSRHYSQALLVPKPDGSWRFCVDYRNLNHATDIEHWPLPRVEALLRYLGTLKAVFFAKMDLTSGYHQMPLAEESAPLTAFITPDGLFEWTRVVMGLSGAGSHFQEAMSEEVIGPELLNHGAIVYMDDVLSYGTTFEEYLTNLRSTFERFRARRIQLNPRKTFLGFRKIEFVGHEIDESGVNFSVKQIDKVIRFSLPSTVRKLQSFLGLLNYFRDHISDYSTLTHSLYDIVATQIRGRISWTAALVQDFEAAKRSVENLPTLYFLRDEGEIHVFTDASDYGVGASVEQWIDGKRFPIRFISKSLSPVQRRWSTIEKECFSIVHTCKTLDYLLADCHFFLHTDHRNLTYITQELSGKVGRWKLLLQQYDFTPIYIQGPENVVADTLSRLCPADEEEPVHDYLYSQKVCRAIPPTVDEHRLILRYHNDMVGHGGIARTCELIKNVANADDSSDARDLRRLLKELTNKVKHVVDSCPNCQRMSSLKPTIHAHLYTNATYVPMKRLSIDTLGPLKETPAGFKFLLVIIDTFSRWVELYPLKTTDAPEAALALLQHSGRFGFAQEFISDSGSQFVNDIISELSKLMLTDSRVTMAYSKEENGIVERSIREVLRHLSHMVLNDKVGADWKKGIPFVQRIINSNVHSAIGVSPAKILFGNVIDLSETILYPDRARQLYSNFTSYTDYVKELIDIQKRIVDAAASAQRETDRLHLSRQVPDVTTFPVGSYVLCRRPQTRMHTIGDHKLDNFPWKGPYLVESVVGDRYELLNITTGCFHQAHVTWLKQYKIGLTTPEEDSLRNHGMKIIKRIKSHQGTIAERSSLKFLVEWEDGSSDSYEPWSNLRRNELVHNYLREHRMISLIPERFRGVTDHASKRPRVTVPADEVIN